MKNAIVVSIICNTYNQVDYIEDALKSFLRQKSSFKYEVLIHDDASTDGTAAVIREYEKLYPDIIKPLIQTENQYSKGVDIIREFQVPRINGTYVAFCEGDDYWLDEFKLQKQVDILDKMPNINMCAHGAHLVREKDKKKLATICPFGERIVSASEVIQKGGGLFATNSLMCRSKLLHEDFNFWNILFIDYSLQIAGALNGGVYFIPECMSAYRYSAKGSWTRAMAKNVPARIELDARTVSMLTALNAETKGIYADAISDRISIIEINTLCLQGKHKLVKTRQFKNAYKKLNVTERALINLHIYSPWVFRFKDWILRG